MLPSQVLSCHALTLPRRETQLKLAGVTQTRQQISAVSGPKFTISWGHAEEILLFNQFFPTFNMLPQMQRYGATQLCDGAQTTNFWEIFCVLHFQQAACSTFQTCILNSHQGHTMCGSMADIQSAMVENRRGKKIDRQIDRRNNRTKI